jgi:hypothetical protein
MIHKADCIPNLASQKAKKKTNMAKQTIRYPAKKTTDFLKINRSIKYETGKLNRAISPCINKSFIVYVLRHCFLLKLRRIFNNFNAFHLLFQRPFVEC